MTGLEVLGNLLAVAHEIDQGPSAIADNVSRLRRALGLTQDQLAEKAGLTGQTIWNVENDEVQPRRDNLEKIAKALGVTSRYLQTPHPSGPIDLPAPLQEAIERKLLKPEPSPEEIVELAGFKFRGKPTAQTYVFLLHALRHNE